MLGEDFSLDLVARVSERLDVDVLVVDLQGDGYTGAVEARSVILVKRTTSWFRQNFSIAHELGHLTSGSLCDGQLSKADASEGAANHFAAELLMPEAELRSIDWDNIALPILADRLWRWGVSTHALDVRLRSLRLNPRSEVVDALGTTTQAFLRGHWRMPPGPDLISQRMERAAERRFPTDLISRLEVAVLEGRAPTGSLAFALGVAEEDLELDLPDIADPAQDTKLLEGLT